MRAQGSIRWAGMLVVAGAISAGGQAYFTPVRASWTEDPATTATITWDTVVAARGTVCYGVTTNYTAVEHDGGGVHKHVVTLRGLEPGTRYYYEASSTDGFVQPGTLRTAPARGQPLHFVFHGDLQGGINEAGAQGVSDQIVVEDPPFVVSLGDMAEEQFSGTGFETWEIFFRICSNELARAVYMPIMGNHDAAPGSDFTRGLYHRLFSLPDPSLGHGQYAYSVGNIRFITLNSEAELTGQAEWLARELQAAVNDTNLVWTVVLWHRPPYSYGERSGWDEGKDNWSPVLAQYETDWMVGGHSHNYQRLVPIRGVRYLITGGAGGRLYWSATNHSAHAFATTCYHHVSAHVTNDIMQLRGIRSDGKVFDAVTVTNRRQVRVEPAFPRRGQAARISYRATEGPLAGANPVYIHIGQDAFTGEFADAPMTWNASLQRWVYEFTVPVTATQRVAFVFRDHGGPTTNWHNNHELDWQALLARASVSPDPPAAGSNVTIRYEANMGPLAGATRVNAWILFEDGRIPATGAVAMANTSGATWECTVPVPAHATRLSFVFSTDGNGWDDDWRRKWTFPVAGTFGAGWPPAPVAGAGSPAISADPPGEPPDNAGDNFDLVMEGPPLIGQETPRGFGDFGRIWVNGDATNLYLGGTGMDIGGSNNVPILFVGVDTLTDNAWTLWHKAGPPNALDLLHNVRFTEPMDLAVILGDTYGDGPAYTNFTFGGYDFGQGVWYLGTNWGEFVTMADAKLSQFHGEGTTPCATGGSSTNRPTRRWEVALPWGAMNAAGPGSVSNLFICGVMASASVQTNDRYLSRTYLGDRAWGLRNGYGQYGFNTIYLRPQRVNLPHGDLHGDGIANAWRQEYFGTPDGPPAREDSDGDGFDNRSEEIAGTHPRDPDSRFAAEWEANRLRWSQAPGRIYDVDGTTNMAQPFAPWATGLVTNGFVPQTSGYYRVRVRK